MNGISKQPQLHRISGCHGKFITLEGGEGVGKSTQIKFLKDYLESLGIQVIATREPGGTKLAEKIRDLLLESHRETVSPNTELLLMFAARAQHVHHVIMPAIEQGQWVISDRFTDATFAYQGGGRKMDMTHIAWLENFVLGSFRPHLTLLLDAPVQIGMERAVKRSKPDRFESEQIVFFNRIRAAYLERAKKDQGRIKVINANQDLSSVNQTIVSEINQFIKKING